MPLIVFVLTISVYDYVPELDSECLARFFTSHMSQEQIQHVIVD
jgi:hypothetical protein